MMVALRFSLKGNKKCILLSLALYLNYQNYKFLNKLFHIHISRNNKNLNIFTFWFHIARNQSSFSRYNGINPVLATFRFSIFAGVYLFTCFRWKFKNRTKRNLGQEIFSSKIISSCTSTL